MPDGNTSTIDAESRRDGCPADEVLRVVREQGGMPAIGGVLARLTDLLERDSEAVHALADTILADASLTQRLLHVANTMPFRTGTAPVTTVTRAILLLGVNRIQAAAVSLVLVDRVVGRENVQRVYADFHQALIASSLAPLLLGSTRDDAELACIAALLRNVGRMLLAVYAPEALAALREGQDARAVVGCSLEDLTAQLLRLWSLPDRLVNATQPLPVRLDGTLAAVDPIRAAANFADEIAETVRTREGAERDGELGKLCQRYAAALLIDEAALATALNAAGERARLFEHGAGLTVPSRHPEPIAMPEGAIDCTSNPPSSERDALGRPANSLCILLSGLADAADAIARGADVATVMQLVLETIYNGLGAARVALALRDASGAIRVRRSFGQPQLAFALPAQGADLFSAALSHATDLHIGDVSVEKVRTRLPPWFDQQCAATKSFLLMPIVSAGRPTGLIYADRAVADPAGPGVEELNALRALRSQVTLALRGLARS